MKKINILQRFKRSIIDFNFSNDYLKEKMSKSIGFLLIGYLFFVLIFGVFSLMITIPSISKSVDTVNSVLDVMGDFNVSEGAITNYNGPEYKEIEFEDHVVVIDLNNTHPVTYYNNFGNYFLINEDGLVSNGEVFFTFMTFQSEFSSEDIRTLSELFVPMMYAVFGILAVFGIGAVFIVSVLVLGLIIILNGFLKKGITTGECYKIAIHSMVVPGIFILGSWMTNLNSSINSLIYIAIAGVYGYMNLKNYNDQPDESESIYE